MTAWLIFWNPVQIPWHWQLWLLLPLCLSVALVYKTVRVAHVSRLPKETLITLGYMIVGLVALAVVLWLMTEYWPH